ncbi:MAG TPA: hypothetical protein DDX89_04595 [Candidatus Omnitrophica bacterium]|nr:hypothetical protein [Candidatus Omnitrophota bacterium]
MRSIETSVTFPLSSVKPLEGLSAYRAYCLDATRHAIAGGGRRCDRSPVSGARLEPFGIVEGLAYLRDPENGSLFLADLPDAEAWAGLLKRVVRFRHSPEAFHADLAQSRTDHVYAPKLEWIQETLRLQQMRRPRLLEVMTAPSRLTPLLVESRAFAEVLSVEEMALAHPTETASGAVVPAHAAVLLESLDRVDDPEALLRGVAHRLEDGGLLFVTALVASGFDLAVLGVQNRYLYPPDRANCFSVRGLEALIRRMGFVPLEVSTPGVLDVSVVHAHLAHEPSIPLSSFERQLMEADEEVRAAFQTFLQQQGFSSFARIVARRHA